MLDVQKSAHSAQEQEVLAYWDQHKIFERSVNERSEDKPYTFYDGPPFATGLPHYGHIVASVMKDVVPRFWTMKGYRVERRWGWDCHGLPIENIVEKKFDLKSKKDIEEYGVGKFNESCEATVLQYAEDWKKVIHRLGRWVDMDNAYRTMDVSFMESIWWVFKSLWDKGLIYEGYKPMHLCPRCETTLSNFEVAQGYLDVTDITVTVSVELTSGPYSGARTLIWTTTPWTLPGNVLLAVGADMEYCLVESDGVKYIVAKSRVEHVFAGKEFAIVDTFIGNKLTGSTYDPIFPYFLKHANAFRVVAAEFVSDDSGTGIVHIAPAFGEDDMNLGAAENVKPLFHVQTNGQFVPEVAEALEAEGYKVDGVPMKAKGAYSEVDIQIIKWLAHHGKLFAKEKIVHSYPHCWRCDTPLLNYAANSWFVKVSGMNDELVKNNEDINWVPDNMKHGRFGKWLEGARDWAISRSRFWGTPLPVWKSEDGKIIVIGSKEELEKLVGHSVTDLHKHVIDNLTFSIDGKEYRRIPEVLDCWFESGSMPYFHSGHFSPLNKGEVWSEGVGPRAEGGEGEARRGSGTFPADFIAEGQDQTRGWFYTLHVLATALFGSAAFKNVIVNGIVLAEDGKKMSKRLSNYPDPTEVMEKYGSDAVRYYLMSSPVVRAENIRFAESGVDEVGKKFITILRNVLSFYKLYAEHDDGRSPSGKHVLDAWIMARLNETLTIETQALESYELADAARVLQSFVTDLSTWYVRRSRDRMKSPTPSSISPLSKGEGHLSDRAEALATLRTVLDTFSKMLAPFMPFLAEMIWLELRTLSDGEGSSGGGSVHLESWPTPSTPLTSSLRLRSGQATSVLEQMGEARAIVSRVMDVRDQTGKAVKQVLGNVTIVTPSGKIAKSYLEVILDEVNIKKATVLKGEELAVELDLTLTPELIREGMARELTRRVNGLRKDAGLTIADRIVLKVWSTSPEVKTMLEEHMTSLLADTLSTAIDLTETPEVAHQVTFRVAEQDIWVGF